MKVKKYILVLINFLILFSWSCGTKNESNNIQSNELEINSEKFLNDKLERVDSLEKVKIISKHNAISSWDTLSFSYQLQESLLERNKIASVEANIFDIVKKDSTYYVKLLYKVNPWRSLNVFYTDANFLLKLNQNQFINLKNQIGDFKKSFLVQNEGIFIFNAKSLNSNYKIIENSNNREQEENAINILIEGDLIDFYIFKN